MIEIDRVIEFDPSTKVLHPSASGTNLTLSGALVGVSAEFSSGINVGTAVNQSVTAGYMNITDGANGAVIRAYDGTYRPINYNASYHAWQVAASEKMRLVTGGILLLGTTTANANQDVGGTYTTTQLGTTNSISSATVGGALFIFRNYVYNATNFKYATSNTASGIHLDGNIIKFYSSASGTAGDNVTPTSSMHLDQTGIFAVTGLIRGGTSGVYAALTLDASSHLIKISGTTTYNYSSTGHYAQTDNAVDSGLSGNRWRNSYTMTNYNSTAVIVGAVSAISGTTRGLNVTSSANSFLRLHTTLTANTHSTTANEMGIEFTSDDGDWTSGTVIASIGVNYNDIYGSQPSLVFSTNAANTAATARMTLWYNGGLTIGSPTGGNKGSGTLNAVGVYDDNTLLTDFVFEPGYKLLSIREMTKFYQKNLHLPTIPGRTEWEKSGSFSLGKIANHLWETVEVHALYFSEIDRRLAALERV